MSTQTTVAPARPRAQVVRVCGAWVLLAGCLVLLGTVLVAGERPTSYDDLRSAVASGDVDEVRITGGMPEVGDGFALTEVHWRRGPVARVTEVVETTSRSEARESGLDAPIVVGRVDGQLTELDPSLQVTRDGDLRRYTELRYWRAPSWTGGVVIVLVIGTLALLVAGPTPWRATRWAWFWLLWTAPPVGMVAFLLLGGATRMWPPARPDARLTGGWAFLLAAVVGAATGALGDAFL